jgi:hypothetical protein
VQLLAMTTDQESLELATLRQRIGLLLAKMHSGSESDMNSACSTLAFLASKPQMQSSLLALGTLGAVNDLLGHATEIVRASCASIIGSLALPQGNKAIVWESGVAKGLLALLNEENTINTKAVAAGALRNLASFEGARLPLFHDGIVPILLELISKGSSAAKHAAMGAITNISGSPEVRSLLSSTGVIDSLIQELASTDAIVRIGAVNALTAIAGDNTNLAIMAARQDLQAHLVAFFTTTPQPSAESEVFKSDSTGPPSSGEIGTSVSVLVLSTSAPAPTAGAMDETTSQTDSSNTPPPAPPTYAQNVPSNESTSSAGLEPPAQSGEDRRLALAMFCGRLLCLLSTHEFSLRLMAAGESPILPAIVANISTSVPQVSSPGSDEIMELSARMLSNISTHAALHDAIFSVGALPPLVTLLQRKDISSETTAAAYATLTHLGVLEAPPVMDEAFLASLGSEQERKQAIGERLFRLIEKAYPVDASFLTGILLRLENSELLQMLTTPEHLRRRMEGAMSALVALRQSDGKSRTQPPPAAIEATDSSSGKEKGKRRKERNEDMECL